MAYFVLGLLLLGLFLLFARSFVKADPRKLAETVRKAGGYGLLGLAAIMALTGRFIAAVPLVGFAMMLLGRGSAWGNMFRGGFPGFGGGQPSEGQTSRVRTATLEMTLEHDSGTMDGMVLAGRFSGARLSDLGLEELITLYRDCVRQDGRAAQLLAAYLDRSHSEWRDRAGPGAQGEGASGASDPMTMDEAYEILGLKSGATPKDIRAAHRSLMKKLHPDQGGSTYLATKVNEAKDVLLRMN